MKRSSIRQKQNIPYACEPRPSLRMTMTAKRKSQKSDGRMSVLPLKRQRLSVNLQSQQLTESRPSLRTNINLMNTVTTTPLNSCQRSIRKQTIINNLVNKLDEQQEIRSIIQTKLRRNSYGPNKQFMYTSEFQPYSSNTSLQVSQKNLTQQLVNLMDNNNTHSMGNHVYSGSNRGGNDVGESQQNSVRVLSSKLRHCQDELDYFKSIVSDMSKKMKLLQRQQSNNGSKIKHNNSGMKGQKYEDTHSQFHETYGTNNHNTNRYASCQCSKGGKSLYHASHNNMLVDADTQTELDTNPISYKVQQTTNYQFDFFDNLDKTLKILSNSKNL